MRAIEYWKMAAAQGLQLSQINLGKLYLEGLDKGPSQPFRVRKDFKLARRYLEQAMEMNGPLRDHAQALLDRLGGESVGSTEKDRGRCNIM